MKKRVVWGFVILCVLLFFVLPVSGLPLCSNPALGIISSVDSCSRDVHVSWGYPEDLADQYAVLRKDCTADYSAFSIIGTVYGHTQTGFTDKNVPVGCYNYEIMPQMTGQGQLSDLCVSVTKEVTVPADCETPAPEFPTAVLPVVLVIGFTGAVFLIHRMRED